MAIDENVYEKMFFRCYTNIIPVAPFGGRLSALLDAFRCAIIGKCATWARGVQRPDESEEEAEARAEKEAELVRAWVRLVLAGEDQSVVAAATAAAADAAAFAAVASLESEDREAFKAVAGDPALLERAQRVRREAADARVWLRLATSEAIAGAARAGGCASLAGLEAAVEEIAEKLMGWEDLKRKTGELAALGCSPDCPPPAECSLLVNLVLKLFDSDAALRQLHDVLLAPLAAALPPPGAALLIVPDLELFVVPWAALAGPSLDGIQLVARHPLRLSPSLAVSAAARARRARPGRALVVGNPWPLCRAGFDPLPQAAEEARMVAELLGVIPLTGSRATRRAVVKQLAEAWLVHLACHGWLERRALLLAVCA